MVVVRKKDRKDRAERLGTMMVMRYVIPQTDVFVTTGPEHDRASLVTGRCEHIWQPGGRPTFYRPLRYVAAALTLVADVHARRQCGQQATRPRSHPRSRSPARLIPVLLPFLHRSRRGGKRAHKQSKEI